MDISLKIDLRYFHSAQFRFRFRYLRSAMLDISLFHSRLQFFLFNVFCGKILYASYHILPSLYDS